MSKRSFVLVGMSMGVLAAAIAMGQTNGKTSQVPKTPWGDPDLQGPWTSDDTWGVPFERPANFGTRAFLTEDELKAREKQVEQSKERIEHPSDTQHSPAKRQLDAEANAGAATATPAPAPAGRGGGRGPSVDSAPVPGQFGEYARRASKQTSQVVDPPNGRIPPLTPEGLARQAATRGRGRGGGPDTWTDWSIYDRCISRGVAGSIIPVIYGNGLEIVQAPGYVAIRYEMVHDTRIIPITGPRDNRAHLAKDVHTYMGDPVGHWEGNTLVVETTNLNDKMGVGANGGGLPYSEDTKLIERFTRMPGNVINYELTVDDPRTYTAPWKVAFPITQEPGYKVFEYACHEGNMSLRNALLGTRADKEKAEAEANRK